MGSLTDFTNDEIRLLHRHKRDDTSSKSMAALAQRWDRFARDYEKTWRGGEPYFEEELEKEKEEKEEEEEEEEEEKEGGGDERLNDDPFTIVRRIDIPEKNKYDGAFGLVPRYDNPPKNKNKNKNDEKSTPKENSKSKIKH